MSDKIDVMFSGDLEKLAGPSELTIHVEKVAKDEKEPFRNRHPKLTGAIAGGLGGVTGGYLGSTLGGAPMRHRLIMAGAGGLGGAAGGALASTRKAREGGVAVRQKVISHLQKLQREEKDSLARSEKKASDEGVDKTAGKIIDVLKGRPEAWRQARMSLGKAVKGKYDVLGQKSKLSARARMRELLNAAKKVAPEAAVAGGATAGALALHHRKRKKQASLDERFAGELHQAVGLDVPSADPAWERPDVAVAGQVTDRIDDHYLAWMNRKADEDVVKEAGVDWKKVMYEAHNAAAQATDSKSAREAAERVIREAGGYGREQVKGGLKALGAAGALTAAGYGAYRMTKRPKKGQEKTAAVIENPENLELIERLKNKSEKLFA